MFGDTEVTAYTGIIALALNLAVVIVGSLVLRAVGAPAGEDITQPPDYEAEGEEPGTEPLPATPEQEVEREPEPVSGRR